VSPQLIAFITLSRREIVRFMRIWTQTILPSPISIILYFLIFGQLIGQRIGLLDDVPYVTYIAPGLIMMAIINNAYGNVVSSLFGAKFAKNIEEMYVAPMSPLVILAGFLSGGVLRAGLVAILATGISLFFTDIHVHSWWITLSIGFLTAILFCLGGVINAIYAQRFDDISIIPTFVLTPLIYLGGVFYSVDMLPKFWFHVSHLNPILYMVNTFRYGMLGVTDIDLMLSFSFVIGFTIALFIWAYILLKKGIGVRS
jgi:ABC-2 type transport system permease protein